MHPLMSSKTMPTLTSLLADRRCFCFFFSCHRLPNQLLVPCRLPRGFQWCAMIPNNSEWETADHWWRLFFKNRNLSPTYMLHMTKKNCCRWLGFRRKWRKATVEAVHASSFGLSNQRKSETMRKRRENDSKENAEILLGGFCLDAEEN